MPDVLDPLVHRRLVFLSFISRVYRTNDLRAAQEKLGASQRKSFCAQKGCEERYQNDLLNKQKELPKISTKSLLSEQSKTIFYL